MVFRQDIEGGITEEQAASAVGEFFARQDYGGRRILLIVPDNSRSGPIGEVFQMIFEEIGEQAAAVDVLVALGTHQGLSEEQICQRLAITADERRGKYRKVNFFNHQWDDPDSCVSVGKISAEEIGRISGGLFYEEVDVSVNKLLFDYDEFFIVGPVFPHEVVGFSGGHKYIFPGIAAAEIIHFFHWLGAVVTNPRINGTIWTATREVVEKAADLIDLPRKLFAVVAARGQWKGFFIGEVRAAWERAAELSARVHISYVEKPFKVVLGRAPQMYDDLWTAGKVMYKLEPVVADGGTLIIYAPHIDEVSYTHGKAIEQIGYHTRDYFLAQMEKFAGVGRGILAHSTHVKGIGSFVDGLERPRINVVLATGISEQKCKRINLGYLDPQQIKIEDYENREDEGILVVEHAGEQLYRLTDGTIPTIPE
ncbi:MAG: DUF2088 domain-containing protein [Sedimentisphaerales bacterium]|nr:DUF2088 domain-containing protein [Sedimentisphaerales bacterium]